MKKKKMTFVVTVQFPEFLVESVVRNYVNMVLKKFDKCAVEYMHHSGYFDGARPYVGFHVSEVNVPDKSDLREVVVQVNKICEHFDEIE